MKARSGIDGSAIDETVDIGTSRAATPHWPKVGLVEGSGPHLTGETHSLLRVRLRAFILLLLFGFGLFFVQRVVAPSPLLGFHFLLIVTFGAALSILYSRAPLSLTQLRSMELSLFWLSAALLAWHQYLVVLSQAEQGNATLALAAVKSHVLYFLCIMVPYGLLIPSSWRRTALIVMPVAIAPVAVSLVLRLRHEAVAQVAEQIATPAQITDHLFVMMIGAACSVYGSHIVNTLRREVFEAKQLGQYRLKEMIGTGGMGEVYRAEHQLMKRQCAIKLIRPGKAADPLALARFEREVQAAAKLTHWNSIEVYDYGRTDDGTFYYVMELLPGLSLSDIVDRYGPMPPARVAHFMDQTCNALREAHSLGLVHRDIKPSNIFAAQRGGVYDVAKLLDFGLVSPVIESDSTQLTQEGAITGSLLYMSPEQAEGQVKPDARSDIYSLGAVAYYLLTGRPPFDTDSPVKLLIAHARDEVVPPSRHRPEVASDLEQVVLRCLAKNPDARFHDARSLQQAIADCKVNGIWSQDDASQWWQQIEQESTSGCITLR